MAQEFQISVKQVYKGDPNSSLKIPTNEIVVNLDGIVGEKHSGFTRAADARDKEAHGDRVIKGEIVRNGRHWTGVEVTEMQAIAEKLQVNFDPVALNPDVLFEGRERFTQLPIGSTIWFPENAVFLVEGENLPCIGPGKEINRQFPDFKTSLFPKAAMGRRGLVGTIYRSGVVRTGDIALVRLYEPRIYSIPEEGIN